MRQDSFERFYYEKVSLEGCGCAEYVSTRLRDLDGLAVNAEVRGIAWTALPERRSVWVRLADRIRKVVESQTGGHSPVSWLIDGLRQRLLPLAVIVGVRRGIFPNVADRPGGWPNSFGFRFGDLSSFPLGASVTSSYAGSCLSGDRIHRASSAPLTTPARSS